MTGAATPRFGLLIDENLSPELADEAKARGFDALHVTWIGLSGQPDRSVARYAIENERTLITNDAVDFRRIYEKKELHPGIVFLTFSDWRLMDLDGQVLTFREALDEIERDFPVNELIEVELSYDEDDLTLTLSRSPLPDWPGW